MLLRSKPFKKQALSVENLLQEQNKPCAYSFTILLIHHDDVAIPRFRLKPSTPWKAA